MDPALENRTSDSLIGPHRNRSLLDIYTRDRSDGPRRSAWQMGRHPCSDLELGNNFPPVEMEKVNEVLPKLIPSEEMNWQLPSTSTSTWDGQNLSDDDPNQPRRRHFYRSKSVSFIPTNPKWRTRFKRNRQKLTSVPLTSKEIRSSLLATAIPGSGDFGIELQEVRNQNSELSASLSDVQAELEALKLSIQVDNDGEVDYVPGTITGAVQDLYRAQKDWQSAMLSRLQQAESRQKEKLLKVAAKLGGAADVQKLDDVNKLTTEKNAALNTLAVTKEKLDSLRICYSLQKSSRTEPSPKPNPVVCNGFPGCGPRHIWRPTDFSRASRQPLTQENDEDDVSGSSTPESDDPLATPMMDDGAEPKSSLDVEAKCLRLERLVAVLRRKVLTS